MTSWNDATIRVRLDDGPHGGQEMVLDTDAEGRAPGQIAVSDPLGADEPRGDGSRARTSYHLKGRDEHTGAYVYLAGPSG